jgi:hypothetical protein
MMNRSTPVIDSENRGATVNLWPVAYLDGKPEGDNSMVRREALYRIPCAAGRNLAGCSWV